MHDVNLQVLPVQGPLTPYQVYHLPELNAVMAFGPLDRGFMPGRITFILEEGTPLKNVKNTWTGRVAWSGSRWGSELDVLIGEHTHRHLGYEDTLRLIRAQAERDAEPRPTSAEEDGMDAYLERLHEQLLVPAVIQHDPPVWMVKSANHGGQGGNNCGRIHVTFQGQVFPGWFEEHDEPYDATTYGIGAEAAARLPAGTVFKTDGTWEHVNAGYRYLFENSSS